MKRNRLLVALGVMTLCLTSCDHDFTDRHNIIVPEYAKIHLVDANTCFEIKDFCFEGNGYGVYGVKVELTTGEKIFCPNGTYILVMGKCPICELKELNNESNET